MPDARQTAQMRSLAVRTALNEGIFHCISLVKYAQAFGRWSIFGEKRQFIAAFL